MDNKDIYRFTFNGALNDYAAIISPEEHESEREQLSREGYIPLCRQVNTNGEKEELWYRPRKTIYYNQKGLFNEHSL